MLLGASNLSIRFPTVVNGALSAFGSPLELFVAKGFGRSYGQESKFFGKKFPGILQCELWDAIELAAPAPTFALVADVGNDLAYEAPVNSIIGWIETTLDRLAAHGSQVVLNNLPLATLQGVGAARYRVFRELFFPSCKLLRADLLTRAEHLSEGLDRIAVERKIAVFSGEFAWYGLDPIHPRWAASGQIWRRMFGALATNQGASTQLTMTTAQALAMRRLKPAEWTQFGLKRRAAQPAARLADGTTIAIY